MKVIRRVHSQYVLRFEYGEEFPAALEAFLKSQKILGSFFYGLGALIDPEIFHYSLKTKKYLRKKFKGEYEVAGLTGNSAIMGKKIITHCHVVLGEKDYRARAGHLVRGKVAGTLEMHLTALPRLRRRRDTTIGLNFLHA